MLAIKMQHKERKWLEKRDNLRKKKVCNII